MGSSYRRRVEVLEAVLGNATCPGEGLCGRCVVHNVLAHISGAAPRPCSNRPGTYADGLNELAFDQRRTLRAALEAEVDRRRSDAAVPAYARTPDAASGSHSPLEVLEEAIASSYEWAEEPVQVTSSTPGR